MTETIHVICAVCKTEEWDVALYRDPALQNDPGYEPYMQRTDHYLETAKVICPDCQRRIEEQKVEAAKATRLTQDIRNAIHSGCIWEDTVKCTFALSDPLKESPNADAWQQAKELAYDERFANHRTASLTGATGLGKTYLGRCLLNAAGEDRGYDQVCEITARGYINAVLQREPRVWKAQHAFFLLFDDVDKVKWSDGTLQMLWELFDLRTHGKFTVITSNLDDKGLVDMLRDACPKNSSLADATMERWNPCLHLEIGGDVSFRRTTKEVEPPAAAAAAEPAPAEGELF